MFRSGRRIVASLTFFSSPAKCRLLTIFAISLLSILESGDSVPGGFFSRFNDRSSNFNRSIGYHHVSRRLVSNMVPIREREKSSVCAYEVVTDVNIQRIPDKIDKVLCLKESCKCSDEGGFRCTQLYTQLNVTYMTMEFGDLLDFELINVEYACVCSRAPGGSHVNLLEPVLV